MLAHTLPSQHTDNTPHLHTTQHTQAIDEPGTPFHTALKAKAELYRILGPMLAAQRDELLQPGRIKSGTRPRRVLGCVDCLCQLLLLLYLKECMFGTLLQPGRIKSGTRPR